MALFVHQVEYSSRWMKPSIETLGNRYSVCLDEWRYEGLSDLSVLYVSIATLKLMCHLIASQCSSHSITEILVQSSWHVITLGSIF